MRHSLKYLSFALVIAIATLAAPGTALCETVNGDLIIIFDQSASMQEYPPRLVAKLWLQTFLNTFAHSRHVALAGFDEKVSVRLRVHSADDKELEPLKERLDKTPSAGRITDFERVFSFLLDYPEQIAIAVIVSDGIPDIYDEKFKQLSKTVRSDPRYEDLNKRYAAMRAQGVSRAERFERLDGLYEARNLELILQKIGDLKERLGRNLVFLDVSGGGGRFGEWSRLAGGKLITVSKGDGENTAERLRTAFASLQTMTSERIKENLPENHSTKIEVPQDSKAKTPRVETPKPPISYAKTPPPAPEPARSPFNVAIISAFAAIIITAAFYLYQRKRQIEDMQGEAYVGGQNDDIHQTGPQAVEEVLEEAPPSFEMLDESVYMDSVRRKYGAMAAISPEAARQYIDNAINEAREAGDEARIKVLEAERRSILFDRRISLRISVPHGVMYALWTDAKGQKKKAPIINISMSGALLDSPDFSSDKIDEIACSKPDGVFVILKSRMTRRSESQVIAMLDEFADNVLDKMKWIETLTRITDDK